MYFVVQEMFSIVWLEHCGSLYLSECMLCMIKRTPWGGLEV